jgi:hypothetical protein
MRAVDHVIEHFPDRTELVRRLYLQDEQFRAICEDFELSITSLRGFEKRPDAHTRPEIDDYRTVLRELEDELRKYLIAAEYG